MGASLHAFPHRVGSFEDGLAAFRAARIRLCLSSLHGVTGSEASALRARALLRIGEAKRAVDELRDRGPDNWFDQGERAMLRAVALGRMDDERSSRELEAARVYGIASGEAALEAEVEYYDAVAQLGAGSIDEAERSCDRGFESAAHVKTLSAIRTIPFPHVAARLEEFRGVLEAGRGNYRQSLAHARTTLQILEACAIKDHWQAGYAVANLGAYVRELDCADDIRNFRDRVASFPWTSELAPKQFLSAQVLAWCAMLRGESVEALRQFRMMASIATCAPDEIQICVDRAIYARALGHLAMATEEVEHGLELAERVDWDASRGDTRVVLLELAQVCAKDLPLRARAMLDRYTAIRSAVPARFASRLEPRIRAEESYTHGLVLRAEGQRHASTERLATAFETWNRIGYEWRAARAAVELAELDAGEIFRLAVRRELLARPDSIFAERARLVA